MLTLLRQVIRGMKEDILPSTTLIAAYSCWMKRLRGPSPRKIRGGFSADDDAALDFDVAEPECAFTRKVLGCVAADGITLPLLRKEQALEKEAQPAPSPLQQP